MDQTDDEEVKQLLYTIDERTRNIEHNLARVENRLNENEEKVKETRQLARDNQRKVNTGYFVGGATITAIITKLAGVLPS